MTNPTARAAALREAIDGVVIAARDVGDKTLDREQWFDAKATLNARLATLDTAVQSLIDEAVKGEREMCLDWIASEARDCGCADRIAAAIRSAP
jgi:hypothetical protein